MRALTRAHPHHHQDEGNESAKLSDTRVDRASDYARPTKDTQSGLNNATGPIARQQEKRGRNSPPTQRKKTLTTFKSLEEGALTPSSSPLSRIRCSAEVFRLALPARARFRASLTISLPALARQKEMTPSLWQEKQKLNKNATSANLIFLVIQKFMNHIIINYCNSDISFSMKTILTVFAMYFIRSL
jgi:hypothetical protein